jgi:hypothetical protein
MRITATLQQKLRDVVIVVIESNHHRSGAFRRRQIDICAPADKRFDARQATTAGSVQERREAAVRVILRARLRRDLAWPIVKPGASIHVCALRNQDPCHLWRTARGRGSPHQRRLILNLFDDVNFRTGINEHLENGEIAILDSYHQRGLVVGVGAFGAGSCIHEHLDHAGITLSGGFRQRCETELVRDVDFGFLRDQLRQQVIIDAIDRPVNRPRPVELSLVDVGSRADHLQRRRALSVLNQLGQLSRLFLSQKRRGRE